MAVTTEEPVRLTIAEGIARLTLCRPDAANAIDLPLAEGLRRAAMHCDRDPAVRAVLLAAEGKMFCAGGDLRSMAAMGADFPAGLKELTFHLHAAQAHFLRMRAPLVVAVHGPAAGAGVGLVAAGDLVIAAESASFTMAYTAIGLTPDGGTTALLPRLIGLRRTQELILTNRRLTAAEAEAWGLITRVVADKDLEEAAGEAVRRLAAGPTLAYGAAKRLLAGSYASPPEAQMEEERRAIAAMAASEDGRAGIRAFLDKQPPAFAGR